MNAEASARRMRGEVRRSLAIAWHTAALTRVRRLPPLEDFIGPEEAESAPASPETTEQERARRKREHEKLVTRMKGKLRG